MEISLPHLNEMWVLVAYWLLSAAVGSLPAPDESSSKGYRWFFAFANTVAANVSRAKIWQKSGQNGGGAPAVDKPAPPAV